MDQIKKQPAALVSLAGEAPDSQFTRQFAYFISAALEPIESINNLVVLFCTEKWVLLFLVRASGRGSPRVNLAFVCCRKIDH